MKFSPISRAATIKIKAFAFAGAFLCCAIAMTSAAQAQASQLSTPVLHAKSFCIFTQFRSEATEAFKKNVHELAAEYLKEYIRHNKIQLQVLAAPSCGSDGKDYPGELKIFLYLDSRSEFFKGQRIRSYIVTSSAVRNNQSFSLLYPPSGRILDAASSSDDEEARTLSNYVEQTYLRSFVNLPEHLKTNHN